MSEITTKPIREVVEAVYRSISRQVLTTLIRLLGNFETAEETMHAAFAVAVERWARDGVPGQPAGLARRAESDITVPAAAR